VTLLYTPLGATTLFVLCLQLSQGTYLQRTWVWEPRKLLGIGRSIHPSIHPRLQKPVPHPPFAAGAALVNTTFHAEGEAKGLAASACHGAFLPPPVNIWPWREGVQVEPGLDLDGLWRPRNMRRTASVSESYGQRRRTDRENVQGDVEGTALRLSLPDSERAQGWAPGKLSLCACLRAMEAATETPVQDNQKAVPEAVRTLTNAAPAAAADGSPKPRLRQLRTCNGLRVLDPTIGILVPGAETRSSPTADEANSAFGVGLMIPSPWGKPPPPPSLSTRREGVRCGKTGPR